MKLKIIDIACHRNGICGAPFDVVLFRDEGPAGSRKVGILFDEPHCCAVLDIDKLTKGDILFGSNSWRGDNYERHLRKAIDDIRSRSDVPMADTLSPASRKPAAAVVCIGLSESEFERQYPLVRNHLDPHASWSFDEGPGCLFGTRGDEFAFVRSQHPRTVWTLVDTDGDRHTVISGLHFVNRLGYLVSQVPVPERTRIEVTIIDNQL